MPTLETRKPLNRPHSDPTTSAASIARGTATASGSPAPPVSRVRINAATMAERLAAPTIDRSMPPVSMVIMMPKARMPYSGNCTAIDCRLRTLKKVPGSTMLNADEQDDGDHQQAQRLAVERQAAHE